MTTEVIIWDRGTEKKFMGIVAHTRKLGGTCAPYPLILYGHRCNLTECCTDENASKSLF